MLCYNMTHKKTVSISIDDDFLIWIDEQIKNKRFANRSHAIEYALWELKQKH